MKCKIQLHIAIHSNTIRNMALTHIVSLLLYSYCVANQLHSYILLCTFIGNKRPTLGDLYNYVVPKFAHKWRFLGALLHFDQTELDIIFSNFRNDVEECCRSLLSRWLKKTADASWDQLFPAIDNLSQPHLPEIMHQGMNQI